MRTTVLTRTTATLVSAEAEAEVEDATIEIRFNADSFCRRTVIRKSAKEAKNPLANSEAGRGGEAVSAVVAAEA